MSSLSLEGTVYFFPAHLLLYNLINELISLWIDDIGDSDPLIQMYSGENWKKKIYENMSLNMQKYRIFYIYFVLWDFNAHIDMDQHSTLFFAIR